MCSSDLFRLLPSRGIDVLRFDFRGGGASDGTHDQGRAERDDLVLAARQVSAGSPVVLVGYSFGSVVCLGVDDESVLGWVGIAPPLTFDFEPGLPAARDARPKLLLVPEHDQYCTPAAALGIVECDAWQSTRVEPVDSTDHFLAGRVESVSLRVVEWISELFG